MKNEKQPLREIDLSLGLKVDEIDKLGIIKGNLDGDQILVCVSGGEYFAVSASCTHYGGPLEEGQISGDTIRCPWHHACFSLRTGEALNAPAFDPLTRYEIELLDGRLYVGARQTQKKTPVRPNRPGHPEKIVIVGGGAAGFAAAEMLRRSGFDRKLTMISEEADLPYDRPNLSKDYLAGTAPEEWLPLKSNDFYEEFEIKLRRRTRARKLFSRERRLVCSDGTSVEYDRLLIATGASAARPAISGADDPEVMTLRSLSDCRLLIGRAEKARSVIIVGAGFLGLEVAGSLRSRGLAVTVVTPEQIPMLRALGQTFGKYVLNIHQEQGVQFHLGVLPCRLKGTSVLLENGTELTADLVILAVGSTLNTELAAFAGLDVARGIRTDEFLETSVPGIFAAGDIAEWRDGTGQHRRVEHWTVAQNQGQTAAMNMLGESLPFDAVPFFWTTHYGNEIQFSGQTGQWDKEDVSGDIKSNRIIVRYLNKGDLTAVASVGARHEQLVLRQLLEQPKEAQRQGEIV